MVDGKPIDGDDARRSRRTRSPCPQLGVLVPSPRSADDAKNQCDYAPCAMSMAHRTITFTFRTGKPGHYRWQCFVPARPASSTASAGRCRRSATWTASSTSSSDDVRRASNASRTTLGRVPGASGSCSASIATPLVAIFARPAIPPGNGSAQAHGAGLRQQVLRRRSRRRCCVLVAALPRLRARSRSAARRAARRSTGRRSAATPASRSSGSSSRPAIVLFLAGFGTLRAASQTAPAAARARAPRSVPRRHRRRWTCR